MLRDIGIEDVARTGQHHFQMLLGEIQRIIRLSGVTNVACCGGAFLNVVAADQLRRQIHACRFTSLLRPMTPGWRSAQVSGSGTWLGSRGCRSR